MTSHGYVPRVEKRWLNEIENDACEVLRRHFPRNLSSPTRLDVLEFWELLEDAYGLLPGVAELSDGVEGMTWPDGRVEVCEKTYRDAVNGKGRARFTLCHEGYHALQHRTQIQNVLVDQGELVLFRRSDIPPLEDPEWQANQFAAHLLMPTKPMQMVLAEAGGKAIEDVMYFFGVTKTAARVRITSVKRQLSNTSRYILHPKKDDDPPYEIHDEA